MQTHINRTHVVSWALYDFANNAFPTLIITFVYATFFEKVITPQGSQSHWALAMGVGAVLIAVLSPIMGALADASGRRKQFLLGATLTCILFTWLLFFPRQGDVLMALIFVVTANVAFEICNVFYNGLLPEIAPRKDMGKISGFGWGVSYIGGLLCLICVLFLFIKPDNGNSFFGLIPPPLKVPSMCFFVGAWYLLFSLPLFLFLKLPAAPDQNAAKRAVGIHLLGTTFQELFRTVRLIRTDYRQIFNLLLARLFYNDGLVTIFAFGGIYAQKVFDFSTSQVLIFGIVINVAAGIGAIGFGFLEDRIGSKKTIQYSLIAFIGVALLAILAPSQPWFWAAAILVGVLSGPNQSASRSLMAKFVPNQRENEFFGLFAFSGKATAFLSPLTWYVLYSLSGNYRVAMGSVLVFFAIGLILTRAVNEQAGFNQAQNNHDHPTN